MDAKMNVFEFEGKTLRVVSGPGGEPMWFATDIGFILGLKGNGAEITRHLDDDEKGVITNHTHGGPQGFIGVYESGLYTLILKSRKAIAKKLRRFVTHDVLPSIRKTGAYVSPGHVPATLEMPETWKQDLPHKIEQTRGCAKGTYEILKNQVVPALEALKAAQVSVSLGGMKPSQAISMLNAISRAVSNPKAYAAASKMFPGLFESAGPVQPPLPGLES